MEAELAKLRLQLLKSSACALKLRAVFNRAALMKRPSSFSKQHSPRYFSSAISFPDPESDPQNIEWIKGTIVFTTPQYLAVMANGTNPNCLKI